MAKKKDNIKKFARKTSLDKVADTVVGLGVPGLVLLVAIEVMGLAGAAAITAALAALGGPFGMLAGIGTLVALGLIAKGVAAYGGERIFRRSVSKMRAEGLTKQEIRQKIERYPISKGLKLKVFNYLDGSDE